MPELDLRQHIANIAEDYVHCALLDAGYQVHQNGYHGKADLVVNGTLRVEVKGSLWVNAAHSKGRYQFNTRNHPDVYVLYCIGAHSRCFVIPGNAIGERRNIAIWSKDPRRYQGRWAKYLNAWDIIAKELAK